MAGQAVADDAGPMMTALARAGVSLMLLLPAHHLSLPGRE